MFLNIFRTFNFLNLTFSLFVILSPSDYPASVPISAVLNLEAWEPLCQNIKLGPFYGTTLSFTLGEHDGK